MQSAHDLAWCRRQGIAPGAPLSRRRGGHGDYVRYLFASLSTGMAKDGSSGCVRTGRSFFSLACRRTVASVPLGISSPGCPLTVTRPGFAECLNCLWLPAIVTALQPSASRRRITSRTFTFATYQLGSPRSFVSVDA
jgi:hypothetical protein